MHKPIRSRSARSRDALPLAAIHAMFFASGAAALICQVIWFKQLQLILGSSTFAVSVTVASFFLGLSLGSWIGGSWADRWKYPLRAYAIMELGVSGTVLAITFLLSHWSTWAFSIAPLLGGRHWLSASLTVALAASILLLPTVLMGATLPLLAKYLVREQQSLAKRIGYLYAINTLGAACGCMAVGLVLIGLIGVFQSAVVASLIYLLVAATAGYLSRACVVGIADETAGDVGNPSLDEPRGVHVLIAVFALSGFASIAYEVLWFRVLANFSLHTVYAFTGMLATYLFGLVIGSLICARFLAPRKDRLLAYFTQVQLLIAIAGTFSLALLGRARNINQAVVEMTRAFGPGELFHDQMAYIFDIMLFCFIVLGLPTILIGVSFPLASELTIHHLGSLGRRLGRLYALNTLSGTVGSLAAGFVLLPLIGSQWSLTLIIGLNAALFLLLMLTQAELRQDRQLWRLGTISAGAAIVAFLATGPTYLKDAQTKFIDAEVLEFVEATDATFAVLAYHSPAAGDHQQLIVNGRSYANNSPPGRRYMSALAHLPTFLHPEPKRALVACIGTGTTVGSLTTHQSFTDIFAVDLSQEVFDVAPHFTPINHEFFKDSRVHQITADGRHFLLSQDRKYDVITFEPPPPNDTGVVNLYSREFYALAKQRLSDSGVMAQWMPLDLPRKQLPRMMIRSMMAEMPHVSLWISNRMEGIAIGSMHPQRIDLESWRRRMEDPTVRDDLHAVGIDHPEDLAAMFVAADGALDRLVGPVPLVTDNHPRIEYHNFYRRGQMKYAEVLEHREPVEAYLTSRPRDLQRLADAKRVMTAIWLEHEATTERDYERSRQYLVEALRLAPQNVYLRYLLEVNRSQIETVEEAPAAQPELNLASRPP